MDGLIGVEFRAPKASALPKFRSPSHGNNHGLADQRYKTLVAYLNPFAVQE